MNIDAIMDGNKSESQLSAMSLSDPDEYIPSPGEPTDVAPHSQTSSTTIPVAAPRKRGRRPQGSGSISKRKRDIRLGTPLKRKTLMNKRGLAAMEDFLREQGVDLEKFTKDRVGDQRGAALADEILRLQREWMEKHNPQDPTFLKLMREGEFPGVVRTVPTTFPGSTRFSKSAEEKESENDNSEDLETDSDSPEDEKHTDSPEISFALPVGVEMPGILQRAPDFENSKAFKAARRDLELLIRHIKRQIESDGHPFNLGTALRPQFSYTEAQLAPSVELANYRVENGFLKIHGYRVLSADIQRHIARMLHLVRRMLDLCVYGPEPTFEFRFIRHDEGVRNAWNRMNVEFQDLRYGLVGLVAREVEWEEGLDGTDGARRLVCGAFPLVC